MLTSKIVTVEADNEDRGKSFLITRLPADQTEWWGLRAMNILLASGIEVPDEVAAQGIVGVIGMFGVSLAGFKGLDMDKVKPLLDEMMTCVQFMPNPDNPGILLAGKARDSQILETGTRFWLRKEVIELHTGFSFGGKQSTSASSPASPA